MRKLYHSPVESVGKRFPEKITFSDTCVALMREERPHVCDRCSKSFTRHEKLKQHTCALSQQRLSEYRCSKCPEVFPSPHDLTVHFRRFHSSGASQASRDDAQPSTSRGVSISEGTNHPTPSTSSARLQGRESLVLVELPCLPTSQHWMVVPAGHVIGVSRIGCLSTVIR
ncbi:zinc finger protein 628-like [Haliotis rubra]|uniref:zinc finger protein 628-like n=1 Tax=Haliotis rubra TaxID=36100 RepID=UPI001EE53581|nr:zinc finger protein 628-like [Haliotis rubra]